MKNKYHFAYGFQRPQDAQPSPNGDDLGGLGGIPQQAFWPVQSG